MASAWYRPNPYGWQAAGKKPPAAKTFSPFTPYQTPEPPPGSYDPNLNAALGQTQRGFVDLQADTQTNLARAATDYGLTADQVNQQRSWQQADLGTNLARGNQDILTQQGQNTEDYQQQLSTLKRGYQQLAGQQAQGDRRAGVTSAGIAMLQAAKRAQNQAIDQQPIDTNYNRSQQALALQQARLYEDASTNSGRLQTTSDQQIAQAALGLSRTQTDLGNQLDRAQRETGQFAIDTAAQKSAQATALGWQIPAAGTPGGHPLNEHTNAQGQTFRTIKQGGYVYQVKPDGTVLSKRRATS